MRAVPLHTSRLMQARAIPEALVRDLLIVVLLTDGEERPSARARLEEALGRELSDRLLRALPGSRGRA